MAVRLLLDEDVRPVLAEILRDRGYDVHHVLELGHAAKTDDEQLGFAVTVERAILTHNIRDFLLLDRAYRSDDRAHWGIVVSDQVPLAELLGRVLRFLSQRTEDEVRNQILWLHDFASARRARRR